MAKREPKYLLLSKNWGGVWNVAGSTAGRDLEQRARRASSGAVHQPEGRGGTNLESHSKPAARWWRTQARSGGEQG
jgi:hypothetical protein